MAEASPDYRPLKMAFIAPQGTLELQNNIYIKRQGCTSEEGSQVTYVVEMARALARRRGYRVDVFGRNYNDNNKVVVVEIDQLVAGVRIINIPTDAARCVLRESFHYYYPEYLARTIEYVDNDENDTHYDCIVGHYADGMLMAVALERHLAVIRNRPTPVMGVTHELTLDREEWSWSEAGPVLRGSIYPGDAASNKHELLERRLACELVALPHMDGMVTLTGHQQYLLQVGYHYPSDRPVAVVPNAVDEKIYCHMPNMERCYVAPSLLETNLSIPEHVVGKILRSRLIFGYGRMVESKGLINAVKAIGILLKKHPQIVYVYAGGVPESKDPEERHIYETCMNLARAGGYSSRVAFMGRRSPSYLARWLNITDVYLHCANPDPYGLAPLEAAACGTPVVLSRTAAVAEFLVNGTDALHLDPNSPEDIADKLGQVLDDNRVPFGMVQRCRRFLPKVASWRVRGDQMLSYLEEWFMPDCLARRATRGATGGSLGNRQCLLDAFAGYGGDQAMRAMVPRLEEARAILILLVGGEALGQIN